MNMNVLSVYLRPDDEKLFDAMLSKYSCKEDILVAVMIGVCASILFSPDEIKMLLGGDK